MADKDVNIAITASDKTGAAFNSVQRSLSGLKAATSGVASTVAGLTSAFAAAGIVTYSKHLLDVADDLGKLSQKTGLAVEDLSAFANAADFAGVSQEDLGNSILKLNKNIEEAAAGADKQMNAFKALGISIRDTTGAIKPTTAILEEIANAYANAADGAGKSANSQDLFGKSGTKLIPLLNTGAKGLREYGNTFGSEFAKNAEMFNDNLTKIQQNIAKFTVEGLDPIIIKFNEFFDELNLGIKTFGSFTDAFIQIGIAIDPFKNIQQSISELNDEIKNNEDAIERYKKSNSDFSSIEKANETLKKRVEYLKQIAQSQALASAKDGQTDAEAKRLGLVKEQAEEKKVIATTNEKIDALLKSQQAKLNELTMSAGQLAEAKFKEVLGQSILNDEQKKQLGIYKQISVEIERIKKSDEEIDSFSKTIEELTKKRLDQEKEAKKQYEDSLSPVSKMAVEMDKISKLRANGLITADQEFEMLNALYDKTDEFNQTIKTEGFGAAMERGMRTYYNSIKDISGLMEDSVVRAFQGMEDALVNFVKTGKLDFTDFANSIINDLIRIQVRQSIVAPLSQAVSGGISSLFGGASTPASPSVDPIASGMWSYAGGGYTGGGSRSGGVDGMGGFPAILHPNETVVDHSIGQSGGVVVNQTINVTTGVQQTVRAEVMNMLPQIANAAKAAVVDAKMRGGSFASALR